MTGLREGQVPTARVCMALALFPCSWGVVGEPPCKSTWSTSFWTNGCSCAPLLPPLLISRRRMVSGSPLNPTPILPPGPLPSICGGLLLL